MSEPKIYKGRGSAEMRDDYIDFINYVFGFNGNCDDFPKLLPKLYKPEYHPCENNYVVTENGKLKAAIGVFVREFDVMGTKLSSHGIGNVAVHPYSRSKGYMIDCMNMALSDMIAAGADMSDLDGQRQRYGYFSYEVASPEYNFDINGTNIRHCFANQPLRELDFVEVAESGELLDGIIELHDKKLCHAIRPREQFLDIVHSWNSHLYAILDGDKLVGYFIGGLGELTLTDNSYFYDVVRNYIKRHGSVDLSLPAWETELISQAQKICGGMHISNNQNYTIFNFEKVVTAFLKLKAATSGLADGRLSFKVNGCAKTECFTISVVDGKPEVISGETENMIELEHHEAISFFFGVISPKRLSVPLSQAWFPLPLYIYSADHV